MRSAAAVALLVLAACSPELAVPNDASIVCNDDASCPEGMVCQTSARLCVRDDAVDEDVPRLVGASALSPTVVRVDFSEPMLAESVGALMAFSIAGLGISLVLVSDDARSVTLVTELQVPELDYVLTVDRVADQALNQLAADTRTTTFDGFGTADESPPQPLAPVATALVKPLLVSFDWSPRAGATSYELQVARDAAFAQPLTRTTQAESHLVVDAGELGVSTHYFWRIRSNISEWSVTTTFEIFDDAVYVFCDEALESCEPAGSGAINDPFTTIGAAIETAAALALPEVRVASRCATPSVCDAAYNGLVVMQDGVSLIGGYEATFVEAPDGATRVTGIAYDGLAVVVASGFTRDEEVKLAGFTIRGTGDQRSDAAYGVVIDRCKSFAVIDCTVIAGNATSGSYGIAVSHAEGSASAPAVRIVDTVVRSSSARERNQAVSIGLASTASDIFVVNSTLRGFRTTYEPSWTGNRSETIAARINFGSLRVERSDLRAGAVDVAGDPADVAACSAVDGRSVGLSVRNTANATIVSSIIESGAACQSIGVRSDSSFLTLSNTTIAAGGGVYGPDDGVSVLGLQLGGDGLGAGLFDPVVVVNSLLVVKGPATSGVDYAGITLSPPGEGLSVEHSTFAGFGTLGLINGVQTTVGELAAAIAALPGGSGRSEQVTVVTDEASLLLIGQLRPSAATPIEVIRQGKSTLAATCGASMSAPCGGLGVDRDDVPRSCPVPLSDCFSRGAYERD